MVCGPHEQQRKCTNQREHSWKQHTFGRRQGVVAQWVALQPMFNVCPRDMDYERIGLIRDASCHQEVLETDLRASLQ